MIKTAISWPLKHLKKEIPIFKLPHLEDSLIQKVVDCTKFKDYMAKVDSLPNTIELTKIEIISVEMFGKNVGFVNMRAITTEDAKPLPSYVFLRGRAVAILLLVNNKMVLTKQFRVPVQQYLLEAPAGTMDEDGDFAGVAAKEIEEETGLKITKEKLEELGEIVTSPGGCDEYINLYLYELEMKEEEVEVMKTKIYGVGEHERIQLEMQEFTLANVLKTKDAKLISAALAYQQKRGPIK